MDQNEQPSQETETEFCPVHNIEMEWIEAGNIPEGGYWFCQDCWDDLHDILL